MVKLTFLFFGCIFFLQMNLYLEKQDFRTGKNLCVFYFYIFKEIAHKGCKMWWPLIYLEQTNRCTQFEIL